MGVGFSVDVDDDGTGTTGTIRTAAWKAAMATAIDAYVVPGTSAPTTTGTQTALALPAGSGDLVLYLNNASLLTIQGIAAGTAGQRLTLISKGAGQVDLAHLHASGTALGKLKLFATSGLTSLAAGSGVAILQYDATVTQWRLVVHVQGAWITAAFVAGNFTANGSMTWTVDAGDVTLFRYRLSGRTLELAFKIDTSSIGGTLNNFLLISNAAYGGFAAALGAVFNMRLSYLNDGSLTEGNARAETIGLTIIKNSVANFAACTNTAAVWMVGQFEVA